jgi:UDP-N-acetylglucosamine--N-acetylmuramyl-(pentapeptide) pyrophosphoryl-undecaprenol N-acetylglucosamine transferase
VKIIITGGGTGGHVTPAIAVIDELRHIAPDAEMLYIGSPAGIEARLSAQAGVPFHGIATGKLRRAAHPIKMINRRNLADVLRVPKGFFQALGAVRTFKPDVVLSTGGYVCVPTVVAAALLRVPVLTHEQTVTVGLANQIAGRFATQIALSFSESLALLSPRLAKKATVTGNPLRQAVLNGSRDHAGRFGFDPTDNALPLVYVTGGAQGSRVINRAIAEVVEELTRHARILHQCGSNDTDELRSVRACLEPEAAQRWQIRQFIEQDEIGDAWALTDVLVGRAGAGTVSEACALAKPAVFIPLEPTSGDEQLKNAARSADAGAAVVVRQASCTGPVLLGAILPLLVDQTRRAAMATASGSLAIPNASSSIAAQLIKMGSSR